MSVIAAEKMQEKKELTGGNKTMAEIQSTPHLQNINTMYF